MVLGHLLWDSLLQQPQETHTVPLTSPQRQLLSSQPFFSSQNKIPSQMRDGERVGGGDRWYQEELLMAVEESLVSVTRPEGVTEHVSPWVSAFSSYHGQR